MVTKLSGDGSSGRTEALQVGNDFEAVVNNFDVDITIYGKNLKAFIAMYFACVPINKETLDAVVEQCSNYASQLSFVAAVIDSPIWNKYSRKSQCHVKPLKYITEQLEENHVDICDGLYNTLVRSLNTQYEFGHRIYFNRNFKKFIALKEKNQQLSNGTTGLSCWQASCDLAHYLLGVGSFLLTGRDVIELGAGCGFAGIAVAASGRARSVTLTDCNPEVLQLIAENCLNNFSEVQISNLKISVKYLDWNHYRSGDFAEPYNLIIASDVMFDHQLALPLASVIRDLLSRLEENEAECILASVKRNEETYFAFLNAFSECHMSFVESFTFENGRFIYEDGRILENASTFLFASSISLPTVFHRIRLNK